METIKGVPVTEQDISEWADEAEQGYDVDRLRMLGELAEQDHVSRPAAGQPAAAVAPRLRPAGRLLEVVILRFDSGNEWLIHAMQARRQYLDLLD